MCPKNKYVISCGEDSTIKIWNLFSGEIFQVLKGHTLEVSKIALTHSNERILIYSASWDRTIKVWNFTNGELLKTYNGHQSLVIGLKISRN